MDFCFWPHHEAGSRAAEESITTEETSDRQVSIVTTHEISLENLSNDSSSNHIQKQKMSNPKSTWLAIHKSVSTIQHTIQRGGEREEVFINHNQTFIVYDGWAFIIQVHADVEKPCSSDLSFTLETEVNKLHGI